MFFEENERRMNEKVLFLITMGGSLKDEIRRDQLEAMKTVMVGDRIRNRATTCEVYAFDEISKTMKLVFSNGRIFD